VRYRKGAAGEVGNYKNSNNTYPRVYETTLAGGQGNVYVKYRDEDSTAKAVAALQGRFYNGRPIVAEFSPVTDFREATVRS
jgi:hypothetical protein